jgi:hypothetical protein
MRRLRFGLLAAAVAASAGVAAPAATSAAQQPAATSAARQPAATSVAARPAVRTGTSASTVGPLFVAGILGLGPALRLPHYCSASVVSSPGHDLVLTAAHCVFGTGLGIEFAPGYSDGVSPYGVWAVRRAYLDPAWVHGQDPQHDFAVLVLARHGGAGVEDRTGTAARLGSAPAAGSGVTVYGYVAGSGGRPVICTASVYYTRGYPSFDCAGYAAGVSGGPWLAGNRLVGVIGGLDRGGCTPTTSYTSAFGPDVRALLVRAEAGGRGDVAPVARIGGCPAGS